MLQEEDKENLGYDDNERNAGENIDFLQQLDNLKLGDGYQPNLSGDILTEEEKYSLKDAAKGILDPCNPVFQENRMSSKVFNT